jgi:glycine/D-amino acid oxidase-like deaminating enzyme
MRGAFDLIVLGGGPAGTSAAAGAAFLGKRVALVEKARELGGAGINTGTLPSKTLRETALVLSGWRSRRLFGVDLSLQREAMVGDFMRHAMNVTTAERARRGAARSPESDALCRHRELRRSAHDPRHRRGKRDAAARREDTYRTPVPRLCARRSFPSAMTASMTSTKSFY